MTDRFAGVPSELEIGASEVEDDLIGDGGEVEAGEMGTDEEGVGQGRTNDAARSFHNPFWRTGETGAGQGETSDSSFGELPSWEVAADIWQEVWVEEVHHSTGLGGNSLTRNEVERLLVDGKAVGSRLLLEYLYVRGYGDASRWVCQQAPETQSLVTLEEICFLHEQTTRLARAAAHEYEAASSPGGVQSDAQQGVVEGGSDQTQTPGEEPGRFREMELPASAEGITPVSWRFVPAEMEKWLAQANEFAEAETLWVSAGKSTTQHPIQKLPEAQAAVQELIKELSEALARIHSRFVKTQPFATANGLVSRLATNLLLVRRGLPPAIIQKRQRDAYQQALQRADLGNFTQLADLFAQGIFRSLAWFAQTELEEGLVPLSALATEEINVAALRVAAARGRLRAKRPPGGRWLSTPEWVADYIATRGSRQALTRSIS